MTEYLNENSEVVLEIDGTLDLHQFAPKDVKTLVPDYLVECQHKGIYEVRIIHGKGKGVLRRTVHAILNRLDSVVDFRLDDKMIGNWGATVVRLKPLAMEDH
ncbi:MAG: Smr/MutS family protein [Desulfofustis sp.]|nr:Smr/MutS family protein [Desulfofustis sp.]